ncbi:tRNA (adenosine(37)-N6)-dimethylallyltransferase MiaA [Candidatus Peregrinibacteria bacterium]|nr:tRNA (adenosine(37)-N6)-dimethylallyltransferase MiaA [Candidatus Peregrinibacteria bacterium]
MKVKLFFRLANSSFDLPVIPAYNRLPMSLSTNFNPNLITDLQFFLQTAKTPLVIILGPTASGKTAASIKIAKLINGEIISTDSRQLYKGMEIGTESIPENERRNIPHHMIGVTTPDKPLTLAEYKDLTTQKIAEIHTRKKIPMLVGGTGLYISAIIDAYDLPSIPPDKKFREKLEKEAKKNGSKFLHEKLQKIDPAAAATIHPNNLPYIIRALEINHITGRNKKTAKSKSPYDIFIIGMDQPRAKLYERINNRVNLQIEKGLVDEVKKLLAAGYKEYLPAMSSLGVKEIIPYIEGEKSLGECVEILQKNTRHYAKRQMTWFRRYDNVRWISPDKL